MKHIKKTDNRHKMTQYFKKDRNKGKRKKQGMKQIQQKVSMKNVTKLKNKRKAKKHMAHVVKNAELKNEVVNSKNSNVNNIMQVKQELTNVADKKLSTLKHKKPYTKQVDKVKNVGTNLTIKSKTLKSKKKQIATNRLQQKPQVNVDKLRALIEKKTKTVNNVNISNIDRKTEKSISKRSPIDDKQVNQKGAIKKLGNANEKHQEPQSLRDRMMAHLKASRFRFINEGLYTSDSSESKQYFKEDPEAFKAYHEGYQQQVELWPLNPLDVIISKIKQLPKDYIIADLGCGEGRLASSVPHKVHSFDLVSINEWVKACDITRTPLLTNSVNVVVFCLSLMGTNLHDYIIECNRVLKKDGILKIAEVESRFERIDDFIKVLSEYGFTNTWMDLSHNLFYFMDFKKIQDITVNRNKLPAITLKPCLYKKR